MTTIPYAQDIRVAQLNIQHMGVAKPFRIAKIMREQNYDVMMLSELQGVSAIRSELNWVDGSLAGIPVRPSGEAHHIFKYIEYPVKEHPRQRINKGKNA